MQLSCGNIVRFISAALQLLVRAMEPMGLVLLFTTLSIGALWFHENGHRLRQKIPKIPPAYADTGDGKKIRRRYLALQ